MAADKDRIILLDALRGLGVLGILLCNAPGFAFPMELSDSVRAWPFGTGPGTMSVWLVTQWLFQRKFVTLFSMLFGISMFLVGGEKGPGARGGSGKGGVLYRRLGWLAVFGVVHGFAIWWGDVLLSYALAGLAVAQARSWSARKLLAWGIGLWVAFSAITLLGLFALPVLPPADQAAEVAREAAKGAADIAAYRGGFLSSLAINARDRLENLPYEPIIFMFTAGLMMIGLGAYKKGVFTGAASGRTYGVLIAIGLGALALVGWPYFAFVAGGRQEHDLRLAEGLQMVTAPLTTLAYVGLMALAARSAGFWRRLPAVLAPVGQMAFTNYIAQSLVMTAIFYGGRGLGLFARLDRPALAVIVVVLWIAQALWSRWWIERFSMGPLEWVWRRLYRGPSPLRR
ncbi:hypothetical protein CFHF_16920 [Caulobacter flavus]|uniref:DUF418 domain-containing protein n=1 Tax=Caulobacter flavus TaxID=1679497 RepID=A0A2N5CR20_9CAUL|nr:DUF418 domain-containing protein [Caulobacter flavus]AYV45591.1 hypothetical protein C1707_04625 [Caulobacter flavus]PLR10631.1 hypothetical protein CFHF_16920 [Caulobacter flavus]